MKRQNLVTFGVELHNRHIGNTNIVLVIRPATLADVDAIREIYNEAILTSTATFDIEPKTREDRLQWFAAHDARSWWPSCLDR